MKEKYKISDSFAKETIDENYLCFSNEEIKDSVNVSTLFYVIGKPEKTAIISYRTMVSRNIPFERKFNSLTSNDSIPNYVYSNMVVDSIRFAGRHIVLGQACAWQSINNIQCRRMGQMNWSEFQDPKRAVEMIKSQITVSKKGVNIDSLQLVDVIFEGQATKALKMSYNIPPSAMLLGGSNTITAYYLVTPVRSRYVACILSHYDDEAPKVSSRPYYQR